MAELNLLTRQDGGSGTVDKALALLEAIAEADGPLRFGDLLKRQPYPKATLHRLLRSLISNGMVAYDERSQTYHLGLRLIRLASGAWARATLAEAARTTLDRLAAEIGETVHLGMLDNAQVLYVDKRTSDRSVAMFSSTGKVGPGLLHRPRQGDACLPAGRADGTGDRAAGVSRLHGEHLYDSQSAQSRAGGNPGSAGLPTTAKSTRQTSSVSPFRS